MLDVKRQANSITEAAGIFSNCGPGVNTYELQYNCKGPGCSSINGFQKQGVTCNSDGGSLSCSNDVKCPPGISSYQSNFTFTQNDADPWNPASFNEIDSRVQQRQQVMLPNCAKFSLTSDGTKAGTKVDDGGKADEKECPKVKETPTPTAGAGLARKTSSTAKPQGSATNRPSLPQSNSGYQRSVSKNAYFITFLFAIMFLFPGTNAYSTNEHRDDLRRRAALRVRDVSDKVKSFAEDFSSELADRANAQGQNGEVYAHNLVADVISSVCDSYFSGQDPGTFTPVVVEDCVKSIYGGEQFPQAAGQFFAVFGASLLCDYAVSEAYPVAAEFFPDGCEGLQEIASKIAPRPTNGPSPAPASPNAPTPQESNAPQSNAPLSNAPLSNAPQSVIPPSDAPASVAPPSNPPASIPGETASVNRATPAPSPAPTPEPSPVAPSPTANSPASPVNETPGVSPAISDPLEPSEAIPTPNSPTPVVPSVTPPVVSPPSNVDTPTPATPTPATPTPGLPTPATPTPGTPTPGTPTPGTPTPGTPTPGTPTPGTPTPGTPTPGSPTPGTPTPGSPTPGSPTPGTPTPGSPTPGTPTPVTPTPGTPTPGTPSPPTRTSTPSSSRSSSISSSTSPSPPVCTGSGDPHFCPGIGCVNFYDAQTCGGCNRKCDYCDDGACYCDSEQDPDPIYGCRNSTCEGLNIDFDFDNQHCGACNRTCAYECYEGLCLCPGPDRAVPSAENNFCNGTTSRPGPTCPADTDFNFNNEHCGACNRTCAYECYEGLCLCPGPGRAVPSVDNNFCNGTTSRPGPTCPADTDFNFNNEHCGACNRTCAYECYEGLCLCPSPGRAVPSVENNFCNGTTSRPGPTCPDKVDLMTDNMNCGACNRTCDLECYEGQCLCPITHLQPDANRNCNGTTTPDPTCPVGIDLMTDNAHCGACNRTCEHECYKGQCLCPVTRLHPDENNKCNTTTTTCPSELTPYEGYCCDWTLSESEDETISNVAYYCSCPNGNHILDSRGCHDGPCPADNNYDPEYRVCCGPGKKYDPQLNDCKPFNTTEECPPGQFMDQGYQKCCLNGTYWDPEIQNCTSLPTPECPPGQYLDQGYNKCCLNGTYWDPEIQNCTALDTPPTGTCPSSHVLIEDLGYCCKQAQKAKRAEDISYYLENCTCLNGTAINPYTGCGDGRPVGTCPDGQHLDTVYLRCCLDGQEFLPQEQVCGCAPPTAWNATQQACTCPGGAALDDGVCPGGSARVASSSVVVDVSSAISAPPSSSAPVPSISQPPSITPTPTPTLTPSSYILPSPPAPPTPSVPLPSSSPLVCPSSLPDQCSGVCVDTKTDLNNCGACGVYCAGKFIWHGLEGVWPA
ncbi:hypothetical protein IQ07DRAFT_25238 [Pyrenochaeta sp. DS3sAY3a]|nr:hypothetical protein IQ07DRAFT_25238 [Pyrenochaeta sp. DS3sAY3a]